MKTAKNFFYTMSLSAVMRMLKNAIDREKIKSGIVKNLFTADKKNMHIMRGKN